MPQTGKRQSARRQVIENNLGSLPGPLVEEVMMAESDSHRRAKARAAGRSGQTEMPLPGGRRLDAASPKRATEIERSGTAAGLRKAAERLKSSRRPQKILQVPQTDMSKAAEAMRRAGVGGTVKNMSGSKRRSVSKKR